MVEYDTGSHAKHQCRQSLVLVVHIPISNVPDKLVNPGGKRARMKPLAYGCAPHWDDIYGEKLHDGSDYWRVTRVEMHRAKMASYNIIDILLIAGISYVLFSLLRPKRPARYVKREDVPTSHNQAYNHAPAAHPPSILFKKYTAQELANFDGKGGDSTRGSDGNRILLAIQRRAKAKDDAAPNGWREVRLERTVFDVTSGGSFYGPGQ